MQPFLDKHAEKITATLSCFDRVVFKGHLGLNYPEAVERLLTRQGLLIKDFKVFVGKLSEQVKAHARAVAEKAGRPFVPVQREVRKEELVRSIASRDGITEGLICVLSALESCGSFKVVPGEKRPRIINARRKCLFLYFYYFDRDLGLMHVRIQTWLPFTIQICLNGHDWLARKLDRYHKEYRRHDNAFTWIEDPRTAQRFADRFCRLNWLRILDVFARRVNPLLKDLLRDDDYYWVTDQAEFSTDVLFKDRHSLECLYRKLLRHATLCFSAEDVLTFLGRKLHGSFQGEVLNEHKTRWPGARVKHRMKENWIKMYDKAGVVLRIETVINHPYEFKIRRYGKRKGQLVHDWFPMAKRVTNLWRYAEVMRRANGRYLDALSVVDDPTEGVRLLRRLCEPVRTNSRPRRGLNPLRDQEQRLFAAVMRGEHLIDGFRNRDLARYLTSSTTEPRSRRTARISRQIHLLRAHGLVAKIPRSRRYRITYRGATIMSAAIYLYKTRIPQEINQCAA